MWIRYESMTVVLSLLCARLFRWEKFPTPWFGSIHVSNFFFFRRNNLGYIWCVDRSQLEPIYQKVEFLVNLHQTMTFLFWICFFFLVQHDLYPKFISPLLLAFVSIFSDVWPYFAQKYITHVDSVVKPSFISFRFELKQINKKTSWQTIFVGRRKANTIRKSN